MAHHGATILQNPRQHTAALESGVLVYSVQWVSVRHIIGDIETAHWGALNL